MLFVEGCPNTRNPTSLEYYDLTDYTGSLLEQLIRMWKILGPNSVTCGCSGRCSAKEVFWINGISRGRKGLRKIII
jgi:hypothetical protein